MTRTRTVHRTIREQIASHLRTEVLIGQLVGGDHLREQPLADRFGVSRGPIRDALLQLTKEGLLVAHENQGVHVRELPGDAIRPLIVNLRRRVETFALEAVFDEITADDLDDWRNNLESFRSACDQEDMAAVVEHDMAFHRSLVECVGYEGLIAIWLPIVTHMMLPYSRHKELLESYREHREILRAIEAGNRDQALRHLQNNIQ